MKTFLPSKQYDIRQQSDKSSSHQLTLPPPTVCIDTIAAPSLLPRYRKPGLPQRRHALVSSPQAYNQVIILNSLINAHAAGTESVGQRQLHAALVIVALYDSLSCLEDSQYYPNVKTDAVYLNLIYPLEVTDYFDNDNSYWVDLLVRLVEDNRINDSEINAVVVDFKEKWSQVGREDMYTNEDHDSQRDDSPYQLVEMSGLYKAVRNVVERLDYYGFKFMNLMEKVLNYSYVVSIPIR